MYISQVVIENFRVFGSGDDKLVLPLQPGLTALVGENDTGKTAIVDALRFVLGTRGQFYIPIEITDFHSCLENGGTEDDPDFQQNTSTSILIQCKFSNLTLPERGTFGEYLTYEDDGAVLYVNWIAKRTPDDSSSRTRQWAEVCSGLDADGPSLDPRTRELLRATYLRPLRDAEREMSAGRNSRLSQVLLVLGEIQAKSNDDGKTILEIGDEAGKAIQEHPAVASSKSNLDSLLEPLSFQDDKLTSHISFSNTKEDNARLRQLLEKLELELHDKNSHVPANRGLGSNNLLFMACEMLLLEGVDEEFPIMLIEEPEAHLHPQRQLRVMQFLQVQAKRNSVQVIVTTHSPQLASALRLENMVIVKNGRAHSLELSQTQLERADYRFLERFLDATKANLFFAKGVLIVEGDAENILIPTIAKLIGKDLSEYGVSIVNVGHVGLSRYARIFQPKTGGKCLDVPVACLADCDVLPDAAPDILGLDKTSEKRRWKHASDFDNGGLEAKREQIRSRAAGGKVKSFVSDMWTLEYELAKSGLLEEMWVAACLAKSDEKKSTKPPDVFKESRKALKLIREVDELAGLGEEEAAVFLATHCYSHFTNNKTEHVSGKTKASKSVAAQYLARILSIRFHNRPDELRSKLPQYIIDAIDYVAPGTGE